MSLEDQLFENMPTKSIKFIDQVINTSLKNEDEEKNRTFLWKNVLKTGNIDRETINKINEKNEHILGFIFKSIRNNNHNKLEINKNFNITTFLSNLETINITAKNNKPILLGLKSFKLISNSLKLNEENWKQIIKVTKDEDLIENLEEITRYIGKFKKNNLNKEEKRLFLEGIVEPIIEKNILDSNHSNILLGALIEAGFENGESAKISDRLMGELINKMPEDNIYVLEKIINGYEEKKESIKYNFISIKNIEEIIKRSKENVSINYNRLLISYKENYADINYIKNLLEKTNEKFIIDTILKKYVKEDIDKITVFLKLEEKNVFKNEKESAISIFDETIDDVIDRISKSPKDNINLLNILLKKGLNYLFYNENKDSINKLSHEQIEKIIDGINYKNKDSSSVNIAGMIMKDLEYKSEYEIKKLNIGFMKKLLEKNKEIPGKNNFLTKYYFNDKYDSILKINEEEFKSYIDIKSANMSNKNQSNFLTECLDNKFNQKKTQSLLNFAIDITNFKTDTTKATICNLMDEIKSAKTEKDHQVLRNKVNAENLEKILFKEISFENVANKIIENIGKMEYIWNISINKEKLIENIDFNNIDFTYDTTRSFHTININVFGKEMDIGVEKNEKITTTIWNQLLQQNINGDKRVFSDENIKVILERVNYENSLNRSQIIRSFFEDEKENNKFVKKLVKEQPELFEEIMNKIIGQSIYELNKYNNRGRLTDITKHLLKLKEEVEFNENIVLKAYFESNKEIEPELFHKAGIVSLMDEKELNNIEVAYDLVKRNKNNFYKLGKQLVEFLQLNMENGEKILKKYSKENTSGVLGYFKRKEKEKLQQKINEAIKYNESQQIDVEMITNEVKKINYSKNFNKEEKNKINEVIERLKEIKKEDLKEISISNNADLKRCMENSFIKVIKNYSKLTIKDKEESPDLREDFINIMNYCLEEIDNKLKNKTSLKMKM